MAIDSLWLGPLQTYQVGGNWMGTIADPGAAALGFAFDSTTGEVGRGPNGDAVHIASTVEATMADFYDTTDLRARIVADMCQQFAASNVIPWDTELTPVWTDLPAPPPSP